MALTVQKATKAFQATAKEAVPIRSPANSLAGGMSMMSLAPCWLHCILDPAGSWLDADAELEEVPLHQSF